MTASPQRALDAPFTLPAAWTPIPGTCSRCGARAWLGEQRWWHQGPTCRARPTNRVTAPVTAEFIPDKRPR
ncbi:hypothetical protein AB0D10_05160 [Kitasatospora sp. NPDC048545]|uniref:hypothetical protein n=1 Tax=Kitasatospora sp. NPDC048545 TaxID=3157208 RepID=UPI0033F3C380